MIIHQSVLRDHLLELFDGQLQLVVTKQFLPLEPLSASDLGANTWDLLGHIYI